MTKYLVIGSGSIARRHIANLRSLFPTAEVACVSASGRTVGAHETQATYLLQGIKEAVEWKPRFAVVASPAPFHLEHALAFLREGVPVLIEKPLADSVAQLARHDAELSAYSGAIEVSYNLRYLSSATRMKELVSAGIAGAIRSISIDLGQYLPDWRPQDDYRKNVSAKRSLGGGVLLELSHELDYMTWLFGKFDRVYGLVSNSGALDIDVEDRADILFSRMDGLVAHVHLDFLQRKATRRCKVVGDQGNLVWDLIANTIHLETRAGIELLFDGTGYDRNQMYLDQLLHFSAVASKDAKPNVGLDSAAYTLKMIAAIRASADQHAPISLQGM